MRGFLLDSHVTARVVPALHRLVPACEIVHLADWRAGQFLHAVDEDIITAASAEDLVFVTYDVHTVPAIVNRLVAGRRTPTGVAIGIASVIDPSDAGMLARVLALLFTEPTAFDPAYPVVYLRPVR